jgi:hypothetical protein
MVSGLRNVSVTTNANTTTTTNNNNNNNNGEVKTSSTANLTFKSGDMLCVHPPMNGGPWWHVENVKIENILSRTENEMLTGAEQSSTTSSPAADVPRINRNFVQPLVCFYRLRKCVRKKYTNNGTRLVTPHNEINSEFDKVSTLFLSTMGKYGNKIQVTAVDRIQNSDMWEDYHVRHERVDKETKGKSDVRIMHYGCPNLSMVSLIFFRLEFF